MRKTLFIIFITILYVNAQGQSKDSLKNNYSSEPHDFSYMNKWKYLRLKKTILVTILDHKPADVACGVLLTASETIVLTQKGDTIRILDLCNLNTYKKGQTVKIEPQKRLICEDKEKNCWATPFTLIENPKTGKFEPNKYDVTVFKTTYGKIIE